ncbi:MAG: hypothetical protein OSJ60_03845 [Lachnospiraceae bacterium]|nr:hypothetical protein [Lachnospiraceae bacterium]
MKKFIITIDTEGDDLWTKKITRQGLKEITTANAENLERFQLLCEKYKFIPTYLVNYEMSQSEAFQQLGKSASMSNKAEIGMHMHAWNSPPIEHLPYNPKGTHTYIGEYSKKLQWEKMKYLTHTLEDVFQVPITSFRSGRWYLDEFTLKCLHRLQFIADCTVTPGVSWGGHIGNHLYGTDYSKDRFRGCYQISGRNIHKTGRSGIYEVPPTILPRLHISLSSAELEIRREWLRPNGDNLKQMLWIVNKISHNPRIDYIEFMIHSSELSPKVNPTFKSEKSIELLYKDLEVLFEEISKKYTGIGLSGYVKSKVKEKAVNEKRL